MRYLIFFFLCSPFLVSAQDTIFFNSNWLIGDKENASYYSTIIPLNGQKYQVKDYSINGELLSECDYKALKQAVDWTRIYEKGFHEWAVEDGVCTEFYPSGNKKKQFEFKNGVQHGKVQMWREDGSLLRSYTAINQLANGNYKEYLADESLSFAVNFLNDTLHGLATYYYPNGKISQKGTFKSGLKYGKWQYFSEKGENVGSEMYRNVFFIAGPDIKIHFPNGLWCLSDQYEEDNRINFLFTRSGIKEDLKTEFVPTCLVSLEEVGENTRLLDYSSARRRRLSVDVHKVISKDQHLFSLPNTMGYLASYIDKGKNKHAAIVTHSVQNNIGVELILDLRQEDYEDLKSEIVTIIRTLNR
ncbi:toxin-antitoxin system YwqK family antitoxin [Ancylomarina longa]|uniref:Toxin-antitoxin system YwqK family antitoxin n=1 Tax=Ancylomarina longa TaxID=2487017 RepID=A0A434AF59_9BACT|nr:toxin-antitoxin system YwqK family antitoxin [Ancylomarina longa]RUT73016.1 toxin-antitoxin system YwqK family antitoxin [Ancylomarina longa]